MHLSIIIVNYNVKFFLEQCLCAVQKATEKINAEIWVVDNASKDGSIAYLQPKYPFVKFIANTQNVGFARANNQALAVSSGEYILFLNPDTIVPEDCFEKCLDFFQANSNAGALGIKMVDGGGKFLPESKRSFPSPVTSFFKLMGLTSLFPQSKLFARYSLGHLDENKSHEVDVLAGAFLMSRRKLLEQLNGFDETFFMYGEDIDLSYRIQKLGYKNYYFADTTIIHFKGESTKKGSLNYIRIFYNAMSVFVSKHYGGGKAWAFRFFIQLAIWLRAGITALFKFLLKIGLPLIDAIIIYGSFEMVKLFWINYARSGKGYGININIALPGFTIVFLLAATLAGIYDRKYKPARAFYAALVAIIVMLAAYSLLPEQLRFSRAIILFGGFTALVIMTSLRWFLLKWDIVEDDDESKRSQRTLIVGDENEFVNVYSILTKAGLQHRVLGRIAVNENKTGSIGTIDQLHTLAETIGVKELIFCEGSLSFQSIIDRIQTLPGNISTRFFSRFSNSIVGSDSKDTSGQSVSIEGTFNLSNPYQRRMKRIIDIVFSLFIFLTLPVHLILLGFKVVDNAVKVVMGRKTWVGYAVPDPKLPVLPQGILATNNPLYTDIENAKNLDFWYAKNYDWTRDIKLIIKNYKNLGTY